MNNINPRIDIPQTSPIINPKFSLPVNDNSTKDKVIISEQKDDGCLNENSIKKLSMNKKDNADSKSQIATKSQGNGSKISLHVNGSSIVVKGTDGDDKVKISQSKDGELNLILNGREKSFTKEDAKAKKIIFNLGEGNNFLFADPKLKYGFEVNVGNGDNKISGGAGNDIITAGNGHNIITGGNEPARAKTIRFDRNQDGKIGRNEYYEVPFGDKITVGDGNNKIDGGLGVDTIIAGNGNNEIRGGNERSKKSYYDKACNELLYGDTIIAGHGDNRIYGEKGSDIITAGNGNNEIYGGDETAGKVGYYQFYDPKGDVITVGNGNNKIVGGKGVDTIIAGNGNNQIYPGSEKDLILDPNYKCIDDIKEPKTAKAFRENTEYVNIIEERYKNADPRVRALYDKYEKKIIVLDINTQNTARYHPIQGNITVNITEDARHRPSAGTTYYHEIGHFMDDKLKRGTNNYCSINKVFTKALHKDLDDFVAKYMKEHDDIKDKDAAYAAIGKMMKKTSSADKYRGVSDIYGGLTENKAQGSWSHSNEYWSSYKYFVNMEAFANMFEVSMGGDPEALQHMKDMLPTAYEEFMKMVEAGT